MTIEAMKGISAMEFALEALVTADKGIIPGGIGSDERSLMKQAITALRQAIKQQEQDWSLLEATQESLREHMAEIKRLRAALEQAEKQENDGFIEFKAKSFECLRLDKRGFHYKGQVIEDAVEAWRRFNDWLTAAFVELAEKQEPVAQAWDEGYQAGVNDERMSEANIGIAGFDAKVEPARNNPYRITQPAPPKREWQGLTDAEIFDVIRLLCADNETAEMLIHVSMDEYRAIEAKLKEKNT